MADTAPDRPDERGASLTFLAWLRSVPPTYVLLNAAIAAVLTFLAPERFVPEPLAPYRPLAALFVVGAFVLTWAWRDILQQRLRLVASSTFLLIVVLAVLNVLFVRAVSYQNPEHTKHYLVGLAVEDAEQEGLRGLSDEQIIRQEGGEFRTLAEIYRGFIPITLGYALCYLLLIPAVVLSVGGSSLAKPREVASEPQAVEPEPRTTP